MKADEEYCHCKYPLFCPICGKEFLPEIESDDKWLKEKLIGFAEYIKESSDDCSIAISVDNYMNSLISRNKAMN